VRLLGQRLSLILILLKTRFANVDTSPTRGWRHTHKVLFCSDQVLTRVSSGLGKPRLFLSIRQSHTAY